jgi:hypothetical protein
MRFVRALWPLPLLVLGAAGLSSGRDDDSFCGLTLSEGTDYGAHQTLWPPGETCHVGTTVAGSGSAAWFLAALGCGLLVWVARRRVPVAWSAVLLFAATGVLRWEAGAVPAFALSLAIGLPVVAVATRSYVRAAGAWAALVLAAFLYFSWFGYVPAFGVALLVVAAVESLPPLRRPQPA